MKYQRAKQSIAIIGLLAILPASLSAQLGGLSLGGSVGYASLAMDDIILVNKNNIVTFRNSGIYMPHFSSIRPATYVAGKIGYEVVYGLSLHLSYLSHGSEVESVFSESGTELALYRSVGTTDIMFGLQTELITVFDFIDLAVELDVGQSEVWAEASALGNAVLDDLGGIKTSIADDSAEYSGVDTFFSAGFIGSIKLAGPLVFNVSARYKDGPAGFLSGTRVNEGVTSDIESETEFDYSGLYFSAGLALEF